MDVWNNEDYKEFRSRFVRRRSQGFAGEYSIDLTPPSLCLRAIGYTAFNALPILRPIAPPHPIIWVGTYPPNAIPEVLNNDAQGSCQVITD